MVKIMAKRALSKASRFERLFKIWEYLRINTDAQHPTSQAKMRESSVSEYIGNKETFNRLIKDMAYTMNYGEYGFKNEADWKLHFNDFNKRFGDVQAEDDYDQYTNTHMHIKDLYYNRTFSYEEINYLIEGVLATKTIDTKTANTLIQKIEDHLTTKFYKKGYKQICKVQEPDLVDREVLKDNLMTIQRAIDNNVQISFRFNGYTYQKKLAPLRAYKDVVSPYYMVAKNGKYYLVACWEGSHDETIKKQMSIWRIDLMSEIEIPNENKALNIAGIPRTVKDEVVNLPQEWNEAFQLSHVHMSFDKPIPIKLRITKGERSIANYTFLHDWFGDTFKYLKTETTQPYNDIVEVICSPYGMVHWALQYSDRVEVLEPLHVRNMVIEKITRLNKTYNVTL